MAYTDPVLAASFIRHDVGDTCRLHAPEVKLLIDAQRNLYKEAKRARAEKDDLPAWYRSTESGLALMPGILADHMAKEVHAFYCTGSFFGYEGGVYQKRDDNWAAGQARAFMEPSVATLHAINDVVGQWRTLIPCSVDALDTDMFMLNLKNGLLDLKTMTLRPHTPDYLSTVQLAGYGPTAKCPAFLNFLRDSLPDADIMALQETAGYLLIPSNAAQVAVVVVGAANAGKSVLLYVLQNVLLGSENVSNIPWQGLSERFNKAELFGKLANIFADLPTRAIEDTGLFKAMTGEDMIVAERKNKDPFTFRPHARMVFSCNEIPRNISDRSDGFYRRLMIYRFAHAVPAEKRDPDLRNKLEAEADGILLWALEGLKRLMERRFKFIMTDSMKREVEQYKMENNSVLMFVGERCVLDRENEISRNDLYSRYRCYCDTGSLKPLSRTGFNRELESNFVMLTRATDKVGKTRTWRGIRYIPQDAFESVSQGKVMSE